MHNQTLLIENFGNIRKIEINIDKLTVLISQSEETTKIITKLLLIFNNMKSINYSFYLFKKELQQHNLLSLLKNNTYIEWKCHDYIFKVKDLNIFGNSTVTHPPGFIKREDMTIYVPSERILACQLLNVLNDFTHLIHQPFTIQEYLNWFYRAANSGIMSFKIPFLNLAYFKKSGSDTFKYFNSMEYQLLSELPSKGQSLIHLFVILQYLQKYRDNKLLYIIEEPELHLYPTDIVHTVNHIFDSVFNERPQNSLILTTNNPYVVELINSKLNDFVEIEKDYTNYNFSAYHIYDNSVDNIINYSNNFISFNYTNTIN